MDHAIKRRIAKRNAAFDRFMVLDEMINEFYSKFGIWPNYMYSEFMKSHRDVRRLDVEIRELRKLPLLKRLFTI